jgi:hypothetical protein
LNKLQPGISERAEANIAKSARKKIPVIAG